MLTETRELDVPEHHHVIARLLLGEDPAQMLTRILAHTRQQLAVRAGNPLKRGHPRFQTPLDMPPLNLPQLRARIAERDRLLRAIEEDLKPTRRRLERARGLAGRSDVTYVGVTSTESGLVFAWRFVDEAQDTTTLKIAVSDEDLQASQDGLFVRIRMEHAYQCPDCGSRERVPAQVIGAIDHCAACGSFGTEWRPIGSTDHGPDLRALVRGLASEDDPTVIAALADLSESQLSDLGPAERDALLRSPNDAVRPWAFARLGGRPGGGRR